MSAADTVAVTKSRPPSSTTTSPATRAERDAGVTTTATSKHPPRLCVQPLASHGTAIAPILIVDLRAVAALGHHLGLEPGPSLRLIVEAATRGEREVLFIDAPPATDWNEAPTVLLDSWARVAANELGKGDIDTSPIGGLIAKVRALDPKVRVSIVTADIYDRRHDAHLLADPSVASIVDLQDGRVITPESWPAELGRVENQPEIEATTTLVFRNGARRDREGIARAFDGDGIEASEDLTPTLKARYAANSEAIAALAVELRGVGASDDFTVERVVKEARAVCSPDDATYVVASIDRSAAGWGFQGLCLRGRAGVRVITDEGAAIAAMREVVATGTGRVVGPRLLDLLGWMAKCGLDLPSEPRDLTILHEAISAGTPTRFRDLPQSATALEPRARRWFFDADRAAPAPAPGALRAILRVTPAIAREIDEELAGRDLQSFVDADLVLTTRALARIEASGIAQSTPEGYVDWSAFAEDLRRHRRELDAAVVALLGVRDESDAPEKLVRAIERKWRGDPRIKLPPMRTEDRLAAYRDIFADELAPVFESRAVDAFLTSALRQQSAQRVHATSVFQSNGRIGLVRPPLQGLPKSGRLGELIRSAFVADSGSVFVAVDYNAFEVRVLAALSNDPVLVAAAACDDAHAHIARLVLGKQRVSRDERGRVKIALLAHLYGQRKQTFVRSNARLGPAVAGGLYDDVAKRMAKALSFGSHISATAADAGTIAIAGGWVRDLSSWPDGRVMSKDARGRRAFNAAVQGAAAAVFRRVLRDLDRLLPPLGAQVVHHAHDEVFVSSPADRVSAVGATIVATMERAGDDILPGVRLVVGKVRTGATWAELLR